jgi:hypothetical protein
MEHRVIQQTKLMLLEKKRLEHEIQSLQFGRKDLEAFRGFFSFFLFFPAVLGFECRAFTLSHSTSSFFVKSFFEIGSLELFALAGFKPRSS